MKRTVKIGTFLFLTAVATFSLKAQVCRTGQVVNFSTNSYELSPREKHKLDSLIGLAANGPVYYEVLGHTDTRGSDEFNFQLASNRIKAVKDYMLKSTKGNKIEIKEYNLGKTRPLYKDTTPDLMAKNRRVEIFAFPVKDGKVTLKDNTGGSMTLDKKYFEPCGICGSESVITEILTANEAAGTKVPFVTADGLKLITGGMVRLDRDCKEQKDSCASAMIRIPSPVNDPDMAIWASSGQGDNLRWVKTTNKLDYDEATREYVMNVDLCNKTWLNIDKPENHTNVIHVRVPSLIRNSQVQPYIVEGDWLQLNSQSDTSFETSCKDCQALVMLHDTGVDENGFTYVYNGPLYTNLKGSVKDVSYYELTRKDYKPLIRYTDSSIVIKIPKKYANSVKLYLPGIDSTMNMRHYEKKKNMFKMKKPAHPFEVRFRKSKSEKYHIDRSALDKAKYNRKKKVYMVKIKKKNMIGAN